MHNDPVMVGMGTLTLNLPTSVPSKLHLNVELTKLFAFNFLGEGGYNRREI